MIFSSFSSLLLATSALVSFTSAEITSPSLSKSVTITYHSRSDPKPKPLAAISYDPQTLTTHLTSWTPPNLPPPLKVSSPSSQPLIFVTTPSGTTTTTTLQTFNTTLNSTINLWLSPSDHTTILSASISASAPLTGKALKEHQRLEKKASRSASRSSTAKAPASTKKSKKIELGADGLPLKSAGNVHIVLNRPSTPPKPALIDRKPAVVGADGQEVPQEQEKSFFQKYWWIFAVGAIVAMQAGGGDK